MSEEQHKEADNLVGVPEPQPPKGGPNADPDAPDPADLVAPISAPTVDQAEQTEKQSE